MTTPVVVLKMVPDNYAHGQLGAIRSLGRMGVPVVGVHGTRWSPCALSSYHHGRAILPIAVPPAPETLGRLIAIGSALDKPVLVVTDDVSALYVDENFAAVETSFRIHRQPAGLLQALTDKHRLALLCEEAGMAGPATFVPADDTDLASYLARATFPIVVKQRDQRLLHAKEGTERVVHATGPDDVWALYRKESDADDSNLLLQEYLRPASHTPWIYTAYFDAESRCRFAATGRKLRDHPPGRGGTTYGVAEENDALMTMAGEFFTGLGYRGIVDTCWQRDNVTGVHKLLDVNPRLGANFRLFVGAGGLDVVRACYLDLTDQPVPADPAVSGRTWVVEPNDRWAIADQRRSGRRTTPTWSSSLRQASELAWWSRDDPRPFVAMTIFSSAQRLDAKLQRIPYVRAAIRAVIPRGRDRRPRHPSTTDRRR